VAEGTRKAPAKSRAKAKKGSGAGGQGRLRVRQVKSGIGHAVTYRRTLEALGLRHQHEVVVADTPSMRGMLHKVRHLVQVSEEA